MLLLANTINRKAYKSLVYLRFMTKRKFINRIDELGRFVGLVVCISDRDCQEDTHTYSYLGARREFYEEGIGLGKEESVYDIEEYMNKRARQAEELRERVDERRSP